MNNEREMLEAAALAVGKKLKWMGVANGPSEGDVFCANWHPRTCGNDSMDLAAALRINVEHNHPSDNQAWVWAGIEGESEERMFLEDVPDESQRADRMRLAILRCAAAQAPKEVA